MCTVHAVTILLLLVRIWNIILYISVLGIYKLTNHGCYVADKEDSYVNMPSEEMCVNYCFRSNFIISVFKVSSNLFRVGVDYYEYGYYYEYGHMSPYHYALTISNACGIFVKFLSKHFEVLRIF